jgi:hypothetical protein
VELPDYDFFSTHALEDAKQLADIYAKQGFTEVEAKPGIHHGTYKVFVNFIGIADITYLHPEIFQALKKKSIEKEGILYAAPNFLRMSMYLELSHPQGDVSRWEKVLKRMILLNKHYPLRARHCNQIGFQRDIENKNKEQESLIFNTVRTAFVEQGAVFFGGYAMSLYSQYMPKKFEKKLKEYPDFDVLSENPKRLATIVKCRLEEEGVHHVTIQKMRGIGEIVSPHYVIKIGNDYVAFIYEPLSCHSYNVVSLGGHSVNVASIDTMLSFYLAFLYSKRDYYDPDRILCISEFLYKVQQHNRLNQRGLLRRFSIQCYGKQETMEEIKESRSKKFMELKDRRSDPLYEEYFLRYRPSSSSPSSSPSSPSPSLLASKGEKTATSKSVVLKMGTRKKKTSKKTSSSSRKKKTRGRGGLFRFLHG